MSFFLSFFWGFYLETKKIKSKKNAFSREGFFNGMLTDLWVIPMTDNNNKNMSK